MSKVSTNNRLKNSQRSHSAKARTNDASQIQIPRISSSKTKKLPPLENSPSGTKNKTSPSDGENGALKTPVSTQDVLHVCQESDCLKVACIELHGYKLTRICDLSKFTRVKSLDLSGNSLTRIEGLDSNQQLRQLKLYDNKIRAVENLDCLSELNELQLQYNLVEAVGPGFVALRNLTSLRLDNNKLRAIAVHELKPLAKTLKILDVSCNEIEDMSAILALKLLEDFKASGNRIKSLPSLKCLEKLSDLELSDNEMCNLRGLEGCLSLTSLHVSRNRLSGDAIAQLQTIFESLDILDVSDNKISRLDGFGRIFPRLSILNICQNEIIDAAQFSGLGLRCIAELDLRNNAIDAYEAELCRAIPTLEMLDGCVVGGTSVPATTYVPKDASSVHPIGARIEQQMREFDTALSFGYEDMFRRFKTLRETLDSDLPHSNEEARPSSKCRVRLEDAKKFSETNYPD